MAYASLWPLEYKSSSDILVLKFNKFSCSKINPEYFLHTIQSEFLLMISLYCPVEEMPAGLAYFSSGKLSFGWHHVLIFDYDKEYMAYLGNIYFPLNCLYVVVV